MVKKFEITSVKYDKLPDIEESYKLLDVIHKKVKLSLSSVSYKVDKPLIIYGAGNLGKMAKDYFDKLNIPILFVIDKNYVSCNNDPFWKGIEVIKPEEVPFHARKLSIISVCVTTTSFSEIKNELSTLGFEDVVPFYDITLSYQDKHPLNNGWITSLLDEQDIRNMKYVTSNLKDDISRAHYLQFISWHTCREEWIFKDALITNDNRYFISEIVSAISNNETFVDIGAHHGEVIEKFINITEGKFNSIYAIEPDTKNFNIIYNILKSIIDERIYLSMKALGEIDESLKFYHGLGYSSQLSDLGNDEIEVKTLDSLHIKPTFIKIHTEGTELEIIKGGLKTIISNRPIIVTTCYHNRDGLWKLPFQLINNLEDYTYYFRLHSWCGTGAVIYAIPEERSF